MRIMRQFGARLLSSCGHLQSNLQPRSPKRELFLALFTIAVLGLSPSGWARPYASRLTNDAGTISFRLNESADSVKIVSAGGATTNDLGALTAGLHTFALGIG